MEEQRGRLRPLFGTLFLTASALAGAAPVQLNIDATEAPRNLVHVHLHIPAAPGPLTLYYPKWIPGEHAPTGPVNDVTGLAFSANGATVDWQRDPVDMFAIHLTVPAGADAVDASFDFLLSAAGGVYSSGGSSTARLLDLSWNQVLFYPKTDAPLKTPFATTLKLPPGWKFGTALPQQGRTGDVTTFSAEPLETLIDSPLIAGENFTTLTLTPGEPVAHYLHIVTDNADDLVQDAANADYFAHVANLVHEENAVFAAHHYREYHFLLTVSDHVAHFGLEHHESSDNRVSANFLTEADARVVGAELLPHEMFHSWNGKYRRPAGLATPDYQQPMRDELLWVYEGLTDYYGKVLATRSGLETPENFRGILALNAATLDYRSGRRWRSLADTAVSAQLLYASPGVGVNRRRTVDFYPEGDLVWLEADTVIRQQTHGEKSLDDFCRRFHGGEDSAPQVAPYQLADVLRVLNEVAPYDWKTFFDQRVYAITPHAPLGGVVNAGWRLAWTNEAPPLLKIREEQRKFTSLDYSLGFSLGADGVIGDVLPDSPADHAGLMQGMKLIAVNNRSWSVKLLREAVKAATTNAAPVTLLTQNDDYYQTFALDYHGGEKYPILERNPGQPDLLADIIKPRTASPANAPAK